MFFIYMFYNFIGFFYMKKKNLEFQIYEKMNKNGGRNYGKPRITPFFKFF